MNLTVEQIITIIRRSTPKNPQDEEDYGYCHALVDMEQTFKEIEQGKRTVTGDWIDDKASNRSKRK